MNGSTSNNYHLNQVKEETSECAENPMPMHACMRQCEAGPSMAPTTSGHLAPNVEHNFEPLQRNRSNTWPMPEAPIEGIAAPEPNLPQAMAAMGMDPAPTKKNTSRRNPWGNMSYADLITRAILASDSRRATLSQIYEWLVNHVDYFKDKGDTNSSAGWKNSIRHNLSLHNRFVRVQNEGTGKSSWWILNPEAKSGKSTRRRSNTLDSGRGEKKRGRTKKKPEAGIGGSVAATPSPSNSLSEVADTFVDSPTTHNPFQVAADFRQRAPSSASSCGAYSPVNGPDAELHDAHRASQSPASFLYAQEFWQGQARQGAYGEGVFPDNSQRVMRQDPWQFAGYSGMSGQNTHQYQPQQTGYSSQEYLYNSFPSYSSLPTNYDFSSLSQMNKAHAGMNQTSHMHQNSGTHNMQIPCHNQSISPAASLDKTSSTGTGENFTLYDNSPMAQGASAFTFSPTSPANAMPQAVGTQASSMSQLSHGPSTSPLQYVSNSPRGETTTRLTVSVAHKEGTPATGQERPVGNGPPVFEELQELQESLLSPNLPNLTCNVEEVIQNELQYRDGDFNFDPSYMPFGTNTDAYSHSLREGAVGQLNGHGTVITPYAASKNLVR